MNVLEASRRQACLDDAGPSVDTIDLLPDLLPLEHPGPVYFVRGLVPGHALEAFQVMPSLMFLQFGLIDLFGVPLYVFLGKIDILSFDHALKLDVV